MAQLTITPDATQRLEELKDHAGDVAFRIDNGCCGGTTLTLMKAQYLGGSDVCIGEVGGVGVYVERSLVRGYESDRYHVYAREGVRDSSFSIEIPHGFKFLMQREAQGPPPACPV